MAVTAKMVKELREMTGAGMMDCKKALNETDGNMDEAVEYLRKNGEAKAVKKAGRIAAEGIVMADVKDDKTAAIVEVNSETDFVAKNAEFQGFVKAVVNQAIPSAAIRPAFLTALASPFFLKNSIAASISPFVSLRAFLQSIIPAPVISLNSFTILAVTAMILSSNYVF